MSYMASEHPLFPKKTISLATYYLGEQIELRKMQDQLKKYTYLSHDHPITVELAHGSYAVLTRFGTVTLWNANDRMTEVFLKEAKRFVKSPIDNSHFKDSLTIHIGAGHEEVTFEEIHLKSVDLEKIKIISYVSAQSVALDRYEHDIDTQLKELGQVVEKLKSPGRARFRQSSVLKHVGNILSVKQKTVSSLALLDKPSEAWGREEIEKLYDHMRGVYELYDRFDILNEKIDFLSENNTTLLNFITSQRANMLEIVVIVLIIVEITLFALSLLKVFP